MGYPSLNGFASYDQKELVKMAVTIPWSSSRSLGELIKLILWSSSRSLGELIKLILWSSDR